MSVRWDLPWERRPICGGSQKRSSELWREGLQGHNIDWMENPLWKPQESIQQWSIRDRLGAIEGSLEDQTFKRRIYHQMVERRISPVVQTRNKSMQPMPKRKTKDCDIPREKSAESKKRNYFKMQAQTQIQVSQVDILTSNAWLREIWTHCIVYF